MLRVSQSDRSWSGNAAPCPIPAEARGLPPPVANKSAKQSRHIEYSESDAVPRTLRTHWLVRSSTTPARTREKLREVAIAAAGEFQPGRWLRGQDASRQPLVPAKSISLVDSRLHVSTPASEWSPYGGGEGLLLLERDLLDQQIIDVHGRKVVRVNDVDIHEDSGNGYLVFKVGAVDVGARGAMRRLLKGVVPGAVLHSLAARKFRRG